MELSRLESVKELFSGRHFDREIIILCVRWYLRYKLSLRDLVEIMAERGLRLAHTTIMRWGQRYVPEFEKRWSRYMRQSGRSWRMDETYLKVRGRWVYLYRAVDRFGNIVDFRLSPKRDVAAAKAFFRKALRTQERAPISITLDGYAASHRAIREMSIESKAWKYTKLRSSKYLNNLIEQDHRGIKFRIKPVLGFKNYDCAATTIAGIEPLRRIGKNQFSFHRLRVKDQAAPVVWNAVLAA
jgi:transposase-like protein